jgi:hypothetical protein
MAITFTTESNLEKLDNTSNPDETFNGNMDLLDTGGRFKITAGAALTQYQAIYIAEADDKAELADANAAGKYQVIGLVADATIDEDADGFAWGIGAIVTNGSWTWDMDKPVFLSDTAGGLSQTIGTIPVIVGFPTAPTKLKLLPFYMNYQMTHIADTAAASAITATSPGSGADATTPNGAEWTAAVTDLGNIKTNLDALNTTQDAILVRLEELGISATS